MSQENFNKHKVNLSRLVVGQSVVKFCDEEERAVYTGTYVGSGAEGWLTIRFGKDNWCIHSDYVLNIFEPESRWK
ncbi:MAG: hypothetical protein KDJ65_24030 [Anaerolineae bacterium]|nr:hypothetical protein [Anaerolineae bacterium]